MPVLIKTKDNKLETLFSERDFGYLIDKYMGCEAADYFRSLTEELEQYREEDEEYDK